jgi:hypothetical protein
MLQQVNLDTIADFLSKAPTIVKSVAPVYWTYLTAPSDGSIILTWEPPRNRAQSPMQLFATDGYIWADNENMFTVETRDYVSHRCFSTSGSHALIFMLGNGVLGTPEWLQTRNGAIRPTFPVQISSHEQETPGSC